MNKVGSEGVCKVQRVKVAAKPPSEKGAQPLALEEMRVLSEKEIKEFLSKEIVEAESDLEDCDNSSSGPIQQQSFGKVKKAVHPKKHRPRKPTEGKCGSISVGPPPPMADKRVGLRMTEDGWVEIDFRELDGNNSDLICWSQQDGKIWWILN